MFTAHVKMRLENNKHVCKCICACFSYHEVLCHVTSRAQTSNSHAAFSLSVAKVAAQPLVATGGDASAHVPVLAQDFCGDRRISQRQRQGMS